MSDARTATPGPSGATNERWRQKVVPLADLARVRAQHRDRTIVLCHGAFDLIHTGHLIHFEEARALGDLLVSRPADKHIMKKRAVAVREDIAPPGGLRDRGLRGDRRRAVGRGGGRGAPSGRTRIDTRTCSSTRPEHLARRHWSRHGGASTSRRARPSRRPNCPATVLPEAVQDNPRSERP
jgi:hypothetical protein